MLSLVLSTCVPFCCVPNPSPYHFLINISSTIQSILVVKSSTQQQRTLYLPDNANPNSYFGAYHPLKSVLTLSFSSLGIAQDFNIWEHTARPVPGLLVKREKSCLRMRWRLPVTLQPVLPTLTTDSQETHFTLTILHYAAIGFKADESGGLHKALIDKFHCASVMNSSNFLPPTTVSRHTKQYLTFAVCCRTSYDSLLIRHC